MYAKRMGFTNPLANTWDCPERETEGGKEDSEERENPVCRWSYDDWDDAWQTECGDRHVFFADGPIENGYRFCPYCGREIKEDKK